MAKSNVKYDENENYVYPEPIDPKNLSDEQKAKLITANQLKIDEHATKKLREAREGNAAGEDDSEGEEEDAAKPRTIFDYDIDCVELQKQEMLKKYPWAAQQIENALTNPQLFPKKFKSTLEQLTNADRYLEEFSSRSSNISFEEQKKLRKVLVEPADGYVSTDYESDMDSIGERGEPSYD